MLDRNNYEQLYKEWKDSNLSKSMFAKQKGINKNTLYTGFKKINESIEIIKLDTEEKIGTKIIKLALGNSSIDISYSSYEELLEILKVIKNV